jgi:ascorbate-specific PTS system EIIC-type component UlaA
MTDAQAVGYAVAAIGALAGVVTTLYWALSKTNEARVKDLADANARAVADKDKEIQWLRGLLAELRQDAKESTVRDDKLAETMRELREAVLAQARGGR